MRHPGFLFTPTLLLALTLKTSIRLSSSAGLLLLLLHIFSMVIQGKCRDYYTFILCRIGSSESSIVMLPVQLYPVQKQLFFLVLHDLAQVWSESVLYVDSCCKSKHLCKVNFREDFVEYMKKTWNMKKSRFAQFSNSFQTRALTRTSYINSQLFILQFIACRHSNLEPELIMRLPSRNFGALSLWMESEWAGSACVSTSSGDTSDGSAEKV